MIDELNEKFNLTGTQKYANFSDIADAVDSYYSAILNNKSHTIKMSEFFKSKMTKYFWLRLHHSIHGDDYGVKISVHNFFSIINSLVSNKTGLKNPSKENYNTESIPKEAKYYLFSGHDNTLVAILAGLGHK